MDYKTTKQDRTTEWSKLEFILNYLNPCEERKARIQLQMQHKLLQTGEYQLTLGLGHMAEPLGLTYEELDRAVAFLQEIAEGFNAEVSVLSKQNGAEGATGNLLVRKKNKELLDVRVALIGESQVGKSTLVGVLSKGVRENGKGSARNAILVHQHEKKQGVTACVSQHPVYFDSQGKVIKPNRTLTNVNSAKTTSFIDLPGHEKYKSTLLNGLISQSPDYAILMIDPSTFTPSTNQDYLNLIAALNLPFFILLCKSEKASNKNLDSVLDFLHFSLSKHNKFLIEVDSLSDSILYSKTFVCEKLVPIFSLSLKTHKNIDLLTQFLNLLPPIHSWDSTSEAEFYIEKCYQKEKGTIFCGFLKKGVIGIGQDMMLGPDNCGNFQSVVIKSIRVNETEKEKATAGQFCSLLVPGMEMEMRKGMVLVENEKVVRTVYEFECWMWTIDSGQERSVKGTYKPLIYMQNSMQCTCIVAGPRVVSSSEPMKFRLRFLYRPEFLECGSRIMVKDSFMTAVGTVSCLKY